MESKESQGYNSSTCRVQSNRIVGDRIILSVMKENDFIFVSYKIVQFLPSEENDDSFS